ncbi:hypothetical protein [Streptomyces sp. NPDC059828]|uniref:hypothetical protein n=1 Tax=Streptomyces sp. NPDC059828 TaxID=3346965 RepID=UPI00364E840C
MRSTQGCAGAGERGCHRSEGGADEVLHLAPVGWYADEFLSQAPREVDMDRDAIAARFAALG